MGKSTIILVGLGLVLGPFAPKAMAQGSDQPWRLGVFVVSNGGKGVKIKEVYDQSPAEALGLVPGQIIWSVNGQKSLSPESFRRQIFQGGDRVSLIILEGGFWYRITARLVPNGMAASAPEGVAKSSAPFQDVQKKRISHPEGRP